MVARVRACVVVYFVNSVLGTIPPVGDVPGAEVFGISLYRNLGTSIVRTPTYVWGYI